MQRGNLLIEARKEYKIHQNQSRECKIEVETHSNAVLKYLVKKITADNPHPELIIQDVTVGVKLQNGRPNKATPEAVGAHLFKELESNGFLSKAQRPWWKKIVKNSFSPDVLGRGEPKYVLHIKGKKEKRGKRKKNQEEEEQAPADDGKEGELRHHDDDEEEENDEEEEEKANDDPKRQCVREPSVCVPTTSREEKSPNPLPSTPEELKVSDPPVSIAISEVPVSQPLDVPQLPMPLLEQPVGVVGAVAAPADSG